MAGAVGFRVKSIWNAKGVKRQVDRRQRRFLTRFGAFVRTRARSLLNKSGGKKNRISMIGQPPRRHKGTLRRNLFFAFDPRVPSVVIGPIIVSGVEGKGRTLESLEEGGAVVFRNKTGKKIRTTVKRRPYMGPAFTEEQSNISSIWRSS